MITLKLWNSLADSSRTYICETIGTRVVGEYHHNFDHDITGKRLKSILECCNLQKDGTINIVVNYKPSYALKKATPKASNKSPKPKASCKVYSDDTRWKFRVYTKSDPDDGFWASGYGCSESAARDYIMSEYWGVIRADCYGVN